MAEKGRDRPRTLEAAGGMPGSNTQSMCKASPQNSSFSTLAGKAFTTVLAGFALTRTVLPNISRLPAFVAGFLRVLIVTKSGTLNLPFFFVSSTAMLASVLSALQATPRFTSQLSAIAAKRALLVITVLFIIGAISVSMAGKQTMLSALEPKKLEPQC